MDHLFPLFLGLVLGLKHSLEPDHLVAVTTIVSQQKHPLTSLRVGVAWGIGHTLTLLVIGMIVLGLKITIPESVSSALEGLVGVMIVFLSIQTLRGRYLHHHHSHHHTGDAPVQPTIQTSKATYVRSFIVGTIHGLAGSGALTVLVLSTVESIWLGCIYMALFGLGSITSMAIAGLLIGTPFALVHEKAHAWEHRLVTASGILGLCFGLYYLWGSVGGMM